MLDMGRGVEKEAERKAGSGLGRECKNDQEEIFAHTTFPR